MRFLVLGGVGAKGHEITRFWEAILWNFSYDDPCWGGGWSSHLGKAAGCLQLLPCPSYSTVGEILWLCDPEDACSVCSKSSDY